MTVFLAAIGIIVFSGIAAAAFSVKQRTAAVIAAMGVVAGSAAAMVPIVQVLVSGSPVWASYGWAVPWGSFSVEIDALSAIFLLPILIISSAAAVYGIDYMAGHKGKPVGTACLFFNLLAAGMMMVVTARNGVLFLVAWEVMSLASYFLVVFENEHEQVRQAGWTYLVATHIGTAFLLAFFAFMGREAGTLDFDKLSIIKSASPVMASILLGLAVAGFGTKAGIMPLHVWLPEAHPAAPSHVSAVMSAVMIKTGIYGILRTLTILPDGPAWWGFVLIGAGAVSGVAGILLALSQHDYKRVLAYSSVENIGIITMGIGLGILGKSTGSNALCILGFGAAILHVLNHAMFKGLLFMCAGAVLHATGTREIDRLGGMMKKMPWTGTMFAVGAAAICGLPGLNGFIGEFVLYLGAYEGCIFNGLGSLVPSIIVIASLALIGGLAVAAFTKVFGSIFLGEARTEIVSHAHEAGESMRAAMVVPAAACVGMSLGAPWVIKMITGAVGQISGMEELAGQQLQAAGVLSMKIVIATLGFGAAAGMLFAVRRSLLKDKIVAKGPTWDCGYARPTARMQYTASSFVQPITEMTAMILRTKKKKVEITEVLGQEAEFDTAVPEPSKEHIFGPIFKGSDMVLGKLRFLQQGSVQLYVLYIAATLICLLLWKLR